MKFTIERRWLILFVLLLLFIFAVTVGADLRLLPLSRIRIPYYDKLGHFLLYGMLAFALEFALQFRAWRMGRIRIPYALLIVGALCVLDEGQQMFMPMRAADITDFGADMLGSVCFLWVADFWGQKSLDAKREGVTIKR